MSTDIDLLEGIESEIQTHDLSLEEGEMLNQYFHDVAGDRQKQALLAPNLRCSQEELLRRAFFLINKTSENHSDSQTALPEQANHKKNFSNFSMFKEEPCPNQKEVVAWIKHLLKRF